MLALRRTQNGPGSNAPGAVLRDRSVAAELLPQLAQRLLVEGRRGLLGVGGVGRRTALLDLGLLGGLDLREVLLEPGPRLLVLALPLGLLRLVAGKPVPGLDVEALRVDVLPSLVVVGFHAVL